MKILKYTLPLVFFIVFSMVSIFSDRDRFICMRRGFFLSL